MEPCWARRLAMAPALLDVAPALLTLAPAVLALAPALLSGCVDSGARARHATPVTKAAALPVLQRQDMFWLERVSFGIDSASVAELHRLGRERYLERQLEGRELSPRRSPPSSPPSRSLTSIRLAPSPT